MNPTTDLPLLQPPQPHRPSTSCDRHPDEHFTGFCPLCLCERLAVLDHNSSSRKPPIVPTTSTAATALKAIFKLSGGANGSGSSKAPFFPELRRTKSFSASKNEGFSGVFEPQRRSCDVRARSTLWSLFNQDDERNPSRKEAFKATEIEVEPRISSSSIAGPVLESKEEEETETETETETDYESENGENGDIVKVSEEPRSLTARNSNANPISEIIEEEEPIAIEPEQVQEEEELDNLKPMKDHIDLDSQTRVKPSSGRDFKEIAGSFWSAASVFSKKLQKWRQKQKLKKRRNGRPGSEATLPVEKPIGRQYRETQSEIADYGFGRRSCDTDPRFSLDAGRISFDDPRYSLDEPRASWDGYLIGKTAFPRMSSTMVSVVEDVPATVVSRSDNQIPVEEPPSMAVPMNAINEDETVPGGSSQTWECYSDSSSKRRKSLDRSNSIRKTAAAVVAEIDEVKRVSNAEVTAATADYFHGNKLVVPDRDLRDSNSNPLREDCSEMFDITFRDHGSVVGNGETKVNKKPRRWSKAFNIWGFIQRRNVSKDEDDVENRYVRANGIDRSFSEHWQELRGERNVEVRGGFNPKFARSNSSVSWRNPQSFGGATFGSARKSNVETNGYGYGRKKKEEFVLERNRSARYSPNNIDNGLLRFYWTPTKNSRRTGWGNSKSNQAHSIARSVLRLY